MYMHATAVGGAIMNVINPGAVVAAVVLTFVASSVWYGVLGHQLAELSPVYAAGDRSPLLTLGVEVVRNTIVVLVVALLISRLDVAGVGGALGLALLLWVGMPVVLLAGSVYHEKAPALLAATHLGDWVIKLVIVDLTIALWR
jgi:hypothetical protein